MPGVPVVAIVPVFVVPSSQVIVAPKPAAFAAVFASVKVATLPVYGVPSVALIAETAAPRAALPTAA